MAEKTKVKKRKPVKRKTFEPKLMRCYHWNGASSGDLNPGKEALAIGARFHGAWLGAYMIRRFGPPNHPSDDRKDLCSWTISTPMSGLALLVTPYLADVLSAKYPACLHFGYRWSRTLAKKVRRDDPRFKEYTQTLERVFQWQRKRYVGLYVKNNADDRMEIALNIPRSSLGKELPREAVGIYQALPYEPDRTAFITRHDFFRKAELSYWIQDVLLKEYQKSHRRRTRKSNGRRPGSMIAYRCRLALRTTIRSLLLPISVRDLCFGVTGLRPDERRLAAPFEFAGWACKIDDE